MNINKYGLLLAGLMLTATAFETKAQVSIRVNIGSQPEWGPVGYQNADYYYLPDVESYYYVPTHQFVYLNGGRWIFAASLPSRYSGYDLYSGYKVVVNRPRPYLNYNVDRVQYAKYKGWNGRQENFRDHKGNPHGMPPGQAKKYYNNGGDRNDHRDNGGDRGHGNEDRDKGHGNEGGDRGHGNNGDHGHGGGEHGHGHGKD